MNDEPSLSPAARALLAAHGRALSPRHDGSAVLAAVQRRVAGTGAPSAEAVRRATKVWIVGGVLGVIALGLLVTRGGPVTITASLGVAVPASAPMLPAEAAPSHGSGARWDPPVSAAPRSAPPQPAARERATDSTPPASSPTVERRDSRSRRGRAAAADRDDLAAELAVLERARTALASHDLVSARDAIDEHRRRFPRGRLQLERQASAVMLACAERTDGATEAARDFLAREEAAPYRRRIEASCEL